MSENQPRWIPKEGKNAKRSDVWQHLKIDRNNKKLIKCDYCSNTFNYTGSTTNMWRHLKAVHKIKGWHESAESAQVTPSHASPLTNDQSVAIQGQKDISSFFEKEKDSLRVIYARLVALNLLSFAVLANSQDLKNGFIAQGFEPYNSDTSVANEVRLYAQEVKEKLKCSIKEFLKSGQRLALTLDEWTSLRLRRYLGINVHLNGEPKGIAMVRIHGTHGAYEAEIHLREKLEDYGISLDKDVISHTTDGESKMLSLGERLDIIHQVWIHKLHVLMQTLNMASNCLVDICHVLFQVTLLQTSMTTYVTGDVPNLLMLVFNVGPNVTFKSRCIVAAGTLEPET